MMRTAKKLLVFISLIFISGCNITGLIIRDGEKITYYFAWANILVIFIIVVAILWIVKSFIKNAK